KTAHEVTGFRSHRSPADRPDISTRPAPYQASNATDDFVFDEDGLPQNAARLRPVNTVSGHTIGRLQPPDDVPGHGAVDAVDHDLLGTVAVQQPLLQCHHAPVVVAVLKLAVRLLGVRPDGREANSALLDFAHGEVIAGRQSRDTRLSRRRRVGRYRHQPCRHCDSRGKHKGSTKGGFDHESTLSSLTERWEASPQGADKNP